LAPAAVVYATATRRSTVATVAKIKAEKGDHGGCHGNPARHLGYQSILDQEEEKKPVNALVLGRLS